MNKAYKAIKQKYTWVNMKKDVERYIKSCESCQKNNLLNPTKKAPIVIKTTAINRFRDA